VFLCPARCQPHPRPRGFFRAGQPREQQTTKLTKPGKNSVSFVCFC
jgi:hypothetical protein